MSNENENWEPEQDIQRVAALRATARNPELYAEHMAKYLRLLLQIDADLRVMQQETRVVVRGDHVEGDRWYHARQRSIPVEMAMREVLKTLGKLNGKIDKSVYKRRAHAEKVKALPEERRMKAAAKNRKKNSPKLLPAPPVKELSTPSTQEPSDSAPEKRYDDSRGIWGLGESRGRESA